MIQKISAFILLCFVFFSGVASGQITLRGSVDQPTEIDQSLKDLPPGWEFAITFDRKNDINIFDTERLQNCNFGRCPNGFWPTAIHTEENGNSYLMLSARQGMQQHLGPGNSYRNELGTKPLYRNFYLDQIEHWYGFRIRRPISDKPLITLANTFTQIKEGKKVVEGVNKNKINCSKGVVFHMSADGFAFNGDGLHYPARKYINQIITNDWKTYIIGIKYSSQKDGWIKVYQDGNLVWSDKCKNLITEYYEDCIGKKINMVDVSLRIGVYAKSDNPAAVNTLHFDDYISSNNVDDVVRFLNVPLLEPELPKTKQVNSPPCGTESALQWKSKTGESASLTIENKSASNVVLWRIADDATREQRGTLPSGDSILLETNVNRPWVLADGEGECQAIVIPKEDAVFEWAGKP